MGNDNIFYYSELDKKLFLFTGIQELQTGIEMRDMFDQYSKLFAEFAGIPQESVLTFAVYANSPNFLGQRAFYAVVEHCPQGACILTSCTMSDWITGEK